MQHYDLFHSHPYSPTRKRTWRIIKFSEPPKFTSFFITQIPPPGAVCPAIVKFFALQRISDFNSILPETVKTIVVASFSEHCFNAHRKDPSPSSLVFVTLTTTPLRPPRSPFFQKPFAVGKSFQYFRCFRVRAQVHISESFDISTCS